MRLDYPIGGRLGVAVAYCPRRIRPSHGLCAPFRRAKQRAFSRAWPRPRRPTSAKSPRSASWSTPRDPARSHPTASRRSTRSRANRRGRPRAVRRSRPRPAAQENPAERASLASRPEPWSSCQHDSRPPMDGRCARARRGRLRLEPIRTAAAAASRLLPATAAPSSSAAGAARTRAGAGAGARARTRTRTRGPEHGTRAGSIRDAHRDPRSHQERRRHLLDHAARRPADERPLPARHMTRAAAVGTTAEVLEDKITIWKVRPPSTWTTGEASACFSTGRGSREGQSKRLAILRPGRSDLILPKTSAVMGAVETLH